MNVTRSVLLSSQNIFRIILVKVVSCYRRLHHEKSLNANFLHINRHITPIVIYAYYILCNTIHLMTVQFSIGAYYSHIITDH